MIAAGAPEEQGLVESINKVGDFGFVKCADRSGGQLYFRLSDVVTEDAIEVVSCL